MKRRQVIEAHLTEGEPQTMARVQGMCTERWPNRVANVWIETAEPRRHVAVRFSRDTIEGAGNTWFEAFEAVDRAAAPRSQRKEPRSEARR